MQEPADIRRSRAGLARASRFLLTSTTWLFLAVGLGAAPFAEIIPFTQPDGRRIELWGEGHEFHAVFETLDGYTVVFDAAARAYCYARLAADGAELVSTGVWVGQGDPATLGLARHLRLSPEAVRRQVEERRRAWEANLEVSVRWTALKALDLGADDGSGQVKSPPSSPTVGTKVGLCLLVDFEDSQATIPQADIEAFCNSDNFTGYGNSGSVKQYFYDVSNGRLTYSNVVTVYIRIPNSVHPKSYYNDTTKGAGGQANLMIRDAIALMQALPNYQTEIVPLFQALTVDSQNRAVALNVFYAGGNGGVWSMGLWPHSGSLSSAVELWPGGKKVSRYQVTNIGSSLSIGTFCHENGHLLCGFPDIYDYDYDSSGGAGRFCLMNSGGSGGNPAQPCAYLKRAAGWATTTDLTSASNLVAELTATAGTNFNHFYRYAKPGNSREYYLIENRQRVGRDSGLPASGLAIWHVDEQGDKDDQSTNYNTSHKNYECSLMQADNQWHFQRDANSGDSRDLYYSGNTSSNYINRFTDYTAPNARWWDGSVSGLRLLNFSVSGNTMTVSVEGNGGAAPPLIAVQPQSQTVVAGTNAGLSVVVDGTEPLRLQWRRDNTDLTGATNRVLVISNAQPVDAGTYSVAITNLYGATNSASANLAVILDTNAPTIPGSFTATPLSCSQVNLQWAAASDPGGSGVAGYRLYRDGELIATTTNLVHVDGGRSELTRYCYTLTAFDRVGIESRPTSPACVTTLECFSSLWIAFNDHYAGSGTHSNATAWNVFTNRGGAPGYFGPLKDVRTGATLPVTLTITNRGVAGGTTAGKPDTNTPAYNVFNGYVDFGLSNLNHSILVETNDVLAHVLSGLDINKLYSLKGTGIRGREDYTNRWALFELHGAVSFTSAHSPGALTRARVSQIASNQVALNTGANAAAGDIFDWENVRPDDTGVLYITAKQYSGPVPGGTSENDNYAYGTIALRVEEFASTNQEPIHITSQPGSLSVAEHQPATFSVGATGSPRFYQWYRGANPIPDATSPSFFIAAAAPSHSDAYSVVITNETGSVTSAPAILTVIPDQTPPRVLGAVGLLNSTRVELSFSETIEPESATENFHATYLLVPTFGGAPLLVGAAQVVNNTNVLLTTAPRVAGRNYTLFVSNVTDQSSQFNLLEPNPSAVSVATELSLVSVSATQRWRFSETGSPVAGWTLREFDDLAWSNGAPVFSQTGGEAGLPSGYVNRTSLRAPSAGGPISTYYRTHFHLPGPPANARLRLSQVVDDGAVFYLNGTEVHRVRMPTGTVLAGTLATNAPEPHPLEGPVFLPTTSLREGDNVLAVEVHQADSGSSDVVMAAELSVVLPSFTETNVVGPRLSIAGGAEGSPALSWFAPTFVLQRAESVLGPWFDVPGATPPYLLNPTNSHGFYRLRR